MIDNLTTENRNSKTMAMDDLSIMEFLSIMNQENFRVLHAINDALTTIEEVIEAVVDAFNHGGRLIYFGAGTSGRLAVLDAVECVPTFGIDQSMVQAIIAGGESAMFRAVEGAEDSEILSVQDLKNIGITHNDIVIGLAASGVTPYVISGLKYAKSIGAKTASISNNKNSLVGQYADLRIEIEVGSEVLTGSTRLKAGTAQKLVLNMISTSAMIAIGKTYSNLMVDLQMNNKKLLERGKRIVMQATGVGYQEASRYIELSGFSSKIAIVMILSDCSREEAIIRLEKGQGFVKRALEIGDL